MERIDKVGLKNKIKWLKQAINNGDYYSKFLLQKLEKLIG